MIFGNDENCNDKILIFFYSVLVYLEISFNFAVPFEGITLLLSSVG